MLSWSIKRITKHFGKVHKRSRTFSEQQEEIRLKHDFPMNRRRWYHWSPVNILCDIMVTFYCNNPGTATKVFLCIDKYQSNHIDYNSEKINKQ